MAGFPTDQYQDFTPMGAVDINALQGLRVAPAGVPVAARRDTGSAITNAPVGQSGFWDRFSLSKSLANRAAELGRRDAAAVAEMLPAGLAEKAALAATAVAPVAQPAAVARAAPVAAPGATWAEPPRATPMSDFVSRVQRSGMGNAGLIEMAKAFPAVRPAPAKDVLTAQYGNAVLQQFRNATAPHPVTGAAPSAEAQNKAAQEYFRLMAGIVGQPALSSILMGGQAGVE